jgi:hypothetical protein
MGTNHGPVFAVDVQQITFMLLCQLLNLAMGHMVKIEFVVRQVFPDRPIADDKTLAFHEFLFIAAMAASELIACSHKLPILAVLPCI